MAGQVRGTKTGGRQQQASSLDDGRVSSMLPQLTGTSSRPKPEKNVFRLESYRDLLMPKAAGTPHASGAQSQRHAGSWAGSGAASTEPRSAEVSRLVPAPEAARDEFWDRHSKAAKLAPLSLEPPCLSRATSRPVVL